MVVNTTFITDINRTARMGKPKTKVGKAILYASNVIENLKTGRKRLLADYSESRDKKDYAKMESIERDLSENNARLEAYKDILNRIK